VQGEIAGAQLQEIRRPDGDIHYRACVTYRYSVGGRTFDCSRLAVDGSLTSQSLDAPLSAIERYRPGMKVTVFHDPADPAYGALEVGPRYTVVGLLIFMAAISVGISLVLLKGSR
jgi:hypothetical protein